MEEILQSIEEQLEEVLANGDQDVVTEVNEKIQQLRAAMQAAPVLPPPTVAPPTVPPAAAADLEEQIRQLRVAVNAGRKNDEEKGSTIKLEIPRFKRPSDPSSSDEAWFEFKRAMRACLRSNKIKISDNQLDGATDEELSDSKENLTFAMLETGLG